MADLVTIAKLMTLEAKATGKARQTLGRQRGLKKALILNLKCAPEAEAGQGDFWTLSLTRWAEQASPTERQLCKDAFSIPSKCKWEPVYVRGWGIIRYTWLGPPPKQLAMFRRDELEATTLATEYYD